MKDTAFYEVAAQIIPVLLFLLAFELRVIGLPLGIWRERPIFFSFLAIMFLALMVAELIALGALASEGELSASRLFVIFTIACAFGVIGAIASLLPRIERLIKEESQSQRRKGETTWRERQ